MSNKIIVIGSGISGLSAAANLAYKGFKVEILEKNNIPGGRLRKLESDGFDFDMGPSWYRLPEIYENFYQIYNHTTSDFYDLIRLDPGYRVIYGKNDFIDIPAKLNDLYELFDNIEKDGARKLKGFLRSSKKRFRLAIKNAVLKSGLPAYEYVDTRLISGLLSSASFHPLSRNIRSVFKDQRLISLLEISTLFMGSSSHKSPALNSLLNYGNLEHGIWYPKGGMQKIIDAMLHICNEQGVEITYNVDVDQLDIIKDKISGAHSGHRNFYGEYFVSSIDYFHTDQKLLPELYSNYNQKYWKSKTMAPSALLYYIGVNKKIPQLLHHNIIMNSDFEKYTQELFTSPKWPETPIIYVTAVTKTNPAMAPAGHENIVVMIPVASGLEDHGKVRDHYFNLVINKLEEVTGTSIRDHIVYHKSYAHTDFINDYNAYLGNAFGLANTLKQTGSFKPKIRNKHIANLYYTGHMTIPGPGIPSAIISGNIVANQVFKASGGHKS